MCVHVSSPQIVVTAASYFVIRDHVLPVQKWFSPGVIVVPSPLPAVDAAPRNGPVVNLVEKYFYVDTTSAKIPAMLARAHLAQNEVLRVVFVEETRQLSLVLSRNGNVLRFAESFLNVATTVVVMFAIVGNVRLVQNLENEHVHVEKQCQIYPVLKMYHHVAILVSCC